MWPPHQSELHRQPDGRRDGEPSPQTAAVVAGPRDREERRLDVVLVLAVEHVEDFSREREDAPSEEEGFAEAQIEPVVRRQADLIPLGPEIGAAVTSMRRATNTYPTTVTSTPTRRVEPAGTEKMPSDSASTSPMRPSSRVLTTYVVLDVTTRVVV